MAIKRYYYSDSIVNFLTSDISTIIGELASNNEFNSEISQINAWECQIKVLKECLVDKSEGQIFFEFSIPRMGSRIDVLILTKYVLLVIEFKVGEKSFPAYALDQVMDYYLDLKNFHEPSH